MQIVIPMSGFGKRFRDAGYTIPKPLIEVNGKPIIAHVMDMFPGENRFFFICNNDHLNNPDYQMASILKNYCPDGKIIEITPHTLGPVHATLEAIEHIDLSQPTIINYCDFNCYWDWHQFKEFVEETNCDGAIPAYRGFHPHSLRPNYYAYLKTSGRQVIAIQEKQPFSNDPLSEYASSGSYYFKTGQLVRKYFQQMKSMGLKKNGEYYVSLAYRPMLEDRLNILVYELQHFMQWGTPEDLEEYNRWSSKFQQHIENPNQPIYQDGTVLIPMAGLGSRFSNAGYPKIKPLIPVSGKPMAIQAMSDLPRAQKQIVVLRQNMPDKHKLIEQINLYFPHTQFVLLDDHTKGQAHTCLMAENHIDQAKPLTIAACDSAAIYSSQKLKTMMDNSTIDLIVWGARGHIQASLTPEMFGWLGVDENNDVCSVSVKAPIKDVDKDPIIIGTFTFRKAWDFFALAKKLIERNGTINDEYYVDSVIEDALTLNMKVKYFEVDQYLNWGSPADLESYIYWQSCFHKWPGHIYRLEHDKRVDKQHIRTLNEEFHRFNQPENRDDEHAYTAGDYFATGTAPTNL